MNKLHTATGDRAFCAPTALSIVFGIPTHEAHRAIRDITDQQPGHVKGVDDRVFYEVAKQLAVANKRPAATFEFPPGMTVGKLLDVLPENVPTLVRAGGHSGHAFAAMNYGNHVKVADTGAWFSRKPRKWDGSKARTSVRAVVYVRAAISEEAS